MDVVLEKTDVYSFAVFMWEVFENGELPFSHLKSAAAQREIKQGLILSQTQSTHGALSPYLSLSLVFSLVSLFSLRLSAFSFSHNCFSCRLYGRALRHDAQLLGEGSGRPMDLSAAAPRDPQSALERGTDVRPRA